MNPKRYHVDFTRTENGHIELVADSHEEALEMARDLLEEDSPEIIWEGTTGQVEAAMEAY